MERIEEDEAIVLLISQLSSSSRLYTRAVALSRQELVTPTLRLLQQ